jgi:superkiller protein 3
MEKFPFLPKTMSVQAQVVAALCLVLVWSIAYRHFSQMDERFFQPSLSGIKGLVFYEIGDYRSAALAYRARLREAYSEERTAADPAWNALLRGDFESAASLSQTALEKDPPGIDPHLNLGEIALERGDLDGALRHFDQVLLLETDQFDALLLSTVARGRQGDYSKAIDLLNRALRRSRVESRITSFLWALRTAGEWAQLPKGERPLALLANFYRYFRIFDSSNKRKAITYAKQAIAAGDHPDEAHLTLGVIQVKNRENDAALASFLKAVEINPRHAEAHRRAAQIYSDRGDLSNEYRMHQAAYQNAPEDPFYADAFSYFLSEKLGDYYQALALTRQFLEAKPESIPLLERAGYLSGFIGEQEEAIDYYQRGLALNPDNPSLYEGLGYTLEQMGRLEEAAAAYEKSISIDPGRSGAYLGLALIHHRERRYPEAIDAYETAFELGNDDSRVKTNLCLLYYRISAFERSVVCFREVLRKDPRNATAEHLLSYALQNISPGAPK